MESQFQLAIFEYLQQVVQAKHPSLEPVLRQLVQGLNIDTTQKSNVDLLKIFKNSNPPISSPTNQEENFKKYVELLSKRGYFDKTEEGSPDYNARLEKARARFFVKFPQDKSGHPSVSDPHADLSLEERTKRGDEHKNLGNNFLQEKKYEEAIKEYTLAIEFNPNPIYYSNRGLAYQRNSQPEKAMSDYRKAIALDPSYTKTHTRLAHTLHELNRSHEALEVIESGLAVEPSNQTLLELKELVSKKQSGGIPQGFPSVPGGMPGMPEGFPAFPGGMPGMPEGFPAFPGGMPGGMPGNFMELLNNPEFMNMATQFVQSNPEIMNMASQIAQNPQLIQQLLRGFPAGMPGGMPGGLPGDIPPGSGGARNDE